jgi:proteasome beta subunit
LGAQFQAVGYAASGSGGATIRSILSFQQRHGTPRPSQMNLGEAIRFALSLLMTASEFDSATGGINPATETYATLKLLRPSGIETIEDQRQKDALKEVGEAPQQ